MTDTLHDLPPEVAREIETVSRNIAREFESSAREDLSQDAWLWLSSNPRQAHWWYIEEGELLFSWRQFRRDLTRCLLAVAKKEQAEVMGYEVDDQYAYGRRVVERYLPYVWHNSVMATIGERAEVKAKTDPAKGGDSAASIMDVREAYDAIIVPGSTWDRALFGTYALGLTQVEMGQQMGVAHQTISDYLSDAIAALIAYLNGRDGFRPGELPKPGRTSSDGPGTRQAMSNATAQSLLE
jgi:hypothetical protein